MEPLRSEPTFLGLPFDLARDRFYSDITLYNRLARLCKLTNFHCKSPEVIRKIAETPLSEKEIERAAAQCLKFGYRIIFERPIPLQIVPCPKFIELELPTPVTGQAIVSIEKNIYSLNNSYQLDIGGYMIVHEDKFLSLEDVEVDGEEIFQPLFYYNSLSRAIAALRLIGYTEPAYHISFFAHQARNLTNSMKIIERILNLFDRRVKEFYALADRHLEIAFRYRYYPLLDYLGVQLYTPSSSQSRDLRLKLLEKLDPFQTSQESNPTDKAIYLENLALFVESVKSDIRNFLLYKSLWFCSDTRLKKN